MGEDVGPSLFVKQDPAYDHQALKATQYGETIGVTHEGTREAPIPGITPLAAKTGESVRIYGPLETCEVLVGATAITASQKVRPDANAKATPALHGFPYGGRALAAGGAAGKVLIVVERGIHDNSGGVVTKTQATSPYTVALADLGGTLTNTGATGVTVFNLPAAVVGYEVRARVDAAFALRLDPNGSEQIALPSTGVPGAVGKYLEADAIGENVHLKCNEAGIWDVVSYTGTWTAEA
jgi:hypothetical protein